MSQFTDPIVVPVRKEKKHYRGFPNTKETCFVSSRICAYLLCTKSELILFLWMECPSTFFFFFTIKRKADGLHLE